LWSVSLNELTDKDKKQSEVNRKKKIQLPEEKMTKEPTMISKILHKKKLSIEQRELH
jgi:hypothetical protein